MRIIFYSLLTAALTLCASVSFAQSAPFEISLEPIQITDLGGLQSYSIGQHDGKWLIVGGRLDGLHMRQPFAAFDVAGNNNQLIVVNPVSGEKWTAPLTSMSIPMQEHLSSTNMEYFQEGDYLYTLGGYGYSATLGDHTTFDKMTAIDVPEVIQAIINETPFTAHFRQVTDAQFQVTGGRLAKIYDTYHLLGGQKFLGRYNPMGPNHGPGFIQEYTDQIRRFTLADDGTSLDITHLTPYTDSENLHRRDYNGDPQILPNGEEGITMFSGVFQPVVDLPYLNSVTVDSSGYAVNNSFNQYFNHYHCPVVPFYSTSQNEMHTVFFGGIAQFYEDAGTLVQDDDVPFVKTIARVSRDANGTMTETKLPIEMPTLLGAGGEFIAIQQTPQFNNGVFKLDSLSTEPTLIGYIFGGISSSQPNIFFINDGTQSTANSQIFKVFAKNTTTSSTIESVEVNDTSIKLSLYPNPAKEELNISIVLFPSETSNPALAAGAEARNAHLLITNASGVLVKHSELNDLRAGTNSFRIDISALIASDTYLVTLETETGKATKKLVIKR